MTIKIVFSKPSRRYQNWFPKPLHVYQKHSFYAEISCMSAKAFTAVRQSNLFDLIECQNLDFTVIKTHRIKRTITKAADITASDLVFFAL